MRAAAHLEPLEINPRRCLLLAPRIYYNVQMRLFHTPRYFIAGEQEQIFLYIYGACLQRAESAFV